MTRSKTRFYKPVETEKRSLFAVLKLPTDKLLLIYARQSTKKQAIQNVESWRQQREQLLELGLENGWLEGSTVLYSENVKKNGELQSVSGTLRIDQRDGLTAVCERIETGKVGAIAVVDVSRLFRQEDLLEPAQFTTLCKKYHVLILTPDGYFDFNDEKRGDEIKFLDRKSVV